MVKKLFTLCIYFCALATSPFTAAQLIQPDVEFLPPTASAVSSQYIHRIHNKLVTGPPLLSPFTIGHSLPAIAPLRTFPVPAIASAPAPLSSFPITQPLATVIGGARPFELPVSQPLVPSFPPTFGVLPTPIVARPVVSEPLISTPARVIAPPVNFVRVPRLRLQIGNRLNYRHRPVVYRRF